jgi:hypothetical protein
MINHLMRTISPRLLSFLIKQFDHCKQQILSSLFGYSLDSNSLPPRVIQWSQLGISNGGLGLGCTRLTRHAAFAASFSTSLDTITQYVPNVQALLAEGSIPYLVDVSSALASIREIGGYQDDGSLERSLLDHGRNCNKLQETLAQPMMKSLERGLKRQCSINQLAWMTSISQYESSAWLDVIPKYADFTIADKEFQAMLCYRYLLPQASIPRGSCCNCARRPELDLLGHHAITGCKCGGGRQNTHDSVKHVITAAGRYCGLKCKEEEIGVFVAAFPDCRKRPDVTVTGGVINARDIVLDISVTCPIPGAELRRTPTTPLTREEAARKGHAADIVVSAKRTKYVGVSEPNNLDFLPMVFESTGYADGVVIGFIDKLAAHASEVRMIPKEVVYKYWIKRISVTLQKALCTAMFKKVLTVTNRANGRFFNQAESSTAVDMDAVHIGHIRV